MPVVFFARRVMAEEQVILKLLGDASSAIKALNDLFKKSFDEISSAEEIREFAATH